MRLKTYTGVWSIIDLWLDRFRAAARRIERAEARKREIAVAREWLRRENSAHAFDERMLRRRASKLLLTVLAIHAWGQSSTPAPAPPTSFVGAGVSYDPSNSPKTVGHVWFALAANASTRTYSWTAVDFLYARHATLTTAVETGVDQWLRNFGLLELHMLGAAGAAVSNATVGGAFSGGGMLVLPIKAGLSIGINTRIIKTTGALGTGSQGSVGLDLIWGR